MTIDKDALKAIVREICGEQRAEIMAEAEKMIASLEKRYGSAENARAAGVDTNFLRHVGVDKAPPNPTYMVGRFAKALVCARGNVEKALDVAKKNADKDPRDKALVGMFEKAMAYSDFSSGGALVPEEFSNEVIGLLYPALLVTGLGADTVPMPNGNLTLPFLDTGLTANYVGEVSNITASQQAVGALQLSAKKLAAIVPISNDLLRSPSARVDQYVQKDMIMRLKVRADLAFYNGSGTNGEPKGVRQWAVAANQNASAGSTLANKVSDLGTAIRVVQEQNVPLEKTGFLMSPRTEWALKDTLDSLGNFIFKAQMEAGTLMGHAYRSSTNVSNTDSSGQSSIVFGAFAHVVIGDTEQIEITAHPDGAYFDGSAVQSGVSQDLTVMRAIARHDLGCRYRGKEISVITGVAWT